MAEGPPPAAAEAQGTSVQPSATPAEVTQPSATATWVLITLAKPGMAPMGKAPPRLVEQMQARLTAALGRTSDDLPALPVQAGNAPPSSLPPMMKAPPPSLLALVPVKKEPPRPPATGGEAMDDGATRQVSQWRCAQDEGATNMVGGTGTRGTPSRFG